MNLEQIDTSTTAGKVRVMQLAERGRAIVCRQHGDAQWIKHGSPQWDWERMQYAVLADHESPAAPRHIWVGFNDGGFVCGTSRTASRDLVRYIRADLAGGDA